jgi:hypothetical protein
VDVQVDESGRDDKPARIDLFVRATANFIGQRDFSDAPIFAAGSISCPPLIRRLPVSRFWLLAVSIQPTRVFDSETNYPC